MPGPHLTAVELAEEFGRTPQWLYDHWRGMVKNEALPAPLHGGQSPLVWSRAQVYAWLDRKLTPQQRATAAAFRAAAAAADQVRLTGRDASDEADWRAKLDEQFLGAR